MTPPAQDIVIIGAGIVGINAAVFLTEAGYKVRVFDPAGIAEMTSRGNAAALAFSDIMPLASPKTMLRAPKWLFDPLGPLSIRPSYLPKLAPWLVRFALASLPARVAASAATQAELMKLAESEATGLWQRAGLSNMIRHDGSLELYQSEAEFNAARTGWDRRAEAGIEFEQVHGTRLAELQPGLSSQFGAATFVPGWKTVSDPYHYARAVWAYAESLGANFAQVAVNRLELGGERPALLLADGTRVEADKIVIAAGAWSTKLLKTASRLKIPLDTERGYNTTLPASAFDLKRQLIFSSHGFVITPLENGVRVGGAVEFAGLDAPPNYARAEAMLKKATDFLPGLDPSGGSQWMGFRPSLPDSLPVMAPLPDRKDVILAFGNGHLGLTQSAAMGRLTRDLIAGDKPAFDLAPLAADRF